MESGFSIPRGYLLLSKKELKELTDKAEELREAKSQLRVNDQHRMLYQGQRDELSEKIEAIKTHLNDYPDEKDEKYSGRKDISTDHHVWNMPYFLIDLETWITTFKEILEPQE